MRTRFPANHTKTKLSVTFKKGTRQTGLAGMMENDPDIAIKVNKQIVGYIHPPSYRQRTSQFGIRFTVKKPLNKVNTNPNCDWYWVFISINTTEEADARMWVKENIMKITEKYILHILPGNQ